MSVLIHPSPAARLSAAWCLRSIAVALPSQMTIFIERCVQRMQRLKSSTEAISGYSFALAALLGSVRETTLGIPHAKGKVSCVWYYYLNVESLFVPYCIYCVFFLETTAVTDLLISCVHNV